MSAGASERLRSLGERYGLLPQTMTKLGLLVERLADDPHAPTSIREPTAIVDQHLADSLVALELEPVRQARLALDLGSGAGFPGLPLAAARQDATFVLLESVRRKCAFLERTATACKIANVEVVNARAESYEAGRGQYDLVTVRAVATLPVNAEYAAPLLRVGGTMVAWAGRRVPELEAAALSAAGELGLSDPEVIPVRPFSQARTRHLYVMSKVMETNARFPRRPGAAVKRPLGRPATPRESSDRPPR